MTLFNDCITKVTYERFFTMLFIVDLRIKLMNYVVVFLLYREKVPEELPKLLGNQYFDFWFVSHQCKTFEPHMLMFENWINPFFPDD